MARPVHICQNLLLGSSPCVYANIVPAEWGMKAINQTDFCACRNKDFYNVAVEVAYGAGKDGIDVWHEAEAIIGPFDPLAGRRYLMESESNNNPTGDTFSVNRWDTDAMGYTLIDWFAPSNKYGFLADDEKALLMTGDKHITLTSHRWESDVCNLPKKAIKVERIETCFGLHGMFDSNTGITMHTSMYSNYLHFSNWVNVTLWNYPQNKRKINPFVDGKELVLNHILNNQNVPVELYERVEECIDLILKGKSINLYTFFDSYGINVKGTLASVSVKNPRFVYSNAKLDAVMTLYVNIRRGAFTKLSVNVTTSTKPNGEVEVHKENVRIPLTPDERNMYLCNIINWMMNNPLLMNVSFSDLEIQDGKSRQFFKSRYHFYQAVRMLEMADKDGLLNASALPTHILKLYSEWKSLTKEWFEEIAQKARPEYDAFKVPMEDINKLLKLDDEPEEKVAIFISICKHITLISKNEILDLWKIFGEAYDSNLPVILWDYLEGVADTSDVTDRSTEDFADSILSAVIDDETWDLLSPNENESHYWNMPKLTRANASMANSTYANMFWEELEGIKEELDEEELLMYGTSVDEGIDDADNEESYYVESEADNSDLEVSDSDSVSNEGDDSYIDDEFMHLPSIETYGGNNV